MNRVQLKKLPAVDQRNKSATPDASQQAALEELRRSVPGVDVRFNPVTGAPDHVMAAGRFLAPAGGQPADAAAPVKRFVSEHAALFGHDAAALDGSRMTREDVTAHNGMRTLVWQQQVDAIPVYNTVFKANLTSDGALITLGSHFLRDAAAATGLTAGQRAALVAQPPMDAARAVSLAAANLGDAVAPEEVLAVARPEGAERKQRFTAPKLSDMAAQLSWLPMSRNIARLAWDVTLMSRKRGEGFRVLVDAQTGGILLRTSLTNDISAASYQVHADGATLQPFDSPAPMSPGWSTPQSGQPVTLSRTLITTQALDTTASPLGWIDDGGTETFGNNVDAHLDAGAVDPAYGTGTHAVSATRVFDFPLDLTQSPSTYQSAVVTQLFFACNYYHDRLYGLGFTESAGNFQQDNFGRGGAGNDAVLADAQDGSGTNNANFTTPPDGSPGRMQMYVFTGPTPNRDGDLDMEIVFHEHTHGLSNRLVGGGVGISALQTGGMGEGWSDFYGLCLLSQPGDDVNGNYAAGAYATYQFFGETENYYYGIRRYPYSTEMTKNPLTLKDIDPTQASAHAGIPYNAVFGAPNGNPSEVHGQGEVWCVTLWEARAGLVNKLGAAAGNEMILRLVTDGMKLSPADPTFLQARDAIIQADLVDNNGANRSELWAAFAKRGMGASAVVPANSTTTGVIEAYDLPDDLGVSPAVALLSTGDEGGPFAPAARTFTLVNNGTASLNWTATDDADWLDLGAGSGSLAAGATSPVTATINAAAASLADGLYSATITFTNTGSGATFLRTVNLRVGQKDYFTEAFGASSPHDISNQSFLFVPCAGASGYAVQRQPVTSFFTDPAGGIALTMSDDTAVQVTIGGGKLVRLYGVDYSSFFIGSNGYITFGSGDAAYEESLATHFNLPRVSALMDDLLPATGQVTARQTADRVAVTWQGVPEWGTSDANTFQIEMFFDGRIRITNLAIAAADGLVGLSRGTGVPVDFIGSDFSAYPTPSPGGGVDHFALSKVASAQIKGVPFSVSLTAQDAGGLTVADYAGAPGLSAAGDAGPVNVSPATAGGFVSGIWTGPVAAGTFGSNVALTVSDGAGHAGTSNAFGVGTGPLHHFAWNAVPGPRSVGAPFGVAISAQDAGGNPVPSFGGTVNLSAHLTNANGSTVVITEVEPNTPDEVEFMNVSALPVDVSGWQIYVYDEEAIWPAPKNVFVIPAGTTCAAGQIFRLQEFGTAPGSFPQFYYGSNLNWTSDGSSHVAVLLRDASGNMVDFFCAASALPSSIVAPASIPASQWSGAPASAPSNSSYGYARSGASDGNTSADWSTAPTDMGVANPGLTLPFPPVTTPITLSPTISGSFIGGAWTGNVAVLQAAALVKLRTDDGAGHRGDSNAFDVLAGNIPYQDWAAGNGLTAANSGLLLDPNFNGVPNLLEWAFGTEPLQSHHRALAVSGGTINARGGPVTMSAPNGSGGTDHFATYCRRKDFVAAGLAYAVEFSGDLSGWVGSNASPVTVADDGVIEVVQIPFPPTARFFRVSVTGP